MEMEGSRRIAAPRAAVWAALTDPAVLMAAIPGCTALVGSAEEGFTAVVTGKVGPITATFEGRLTLTDMAAPDRCTILGEGGGGAGKARGRADVALADDADGTLLAYAMTAEVDGKLARLGGRLVEGAARWMADAFFDNLAAAIAPPPEGGPAPAKRPGWFRRATGRA